MGPMIETNQQELPAGATHFVLNVPTSCLFFAAKKEERLDAILAGSGLVSLHPGKLTWNPHMEVWKMIFLFSWVMLKFHVMFQGCRFS